MTPPDDHPGGPNRRRAAAIATGAAFGRLAAGYGLDAKPTTSAQRAAVSMLVGERMAVCSHLLGKQPGEEPTLVLGALSGVLLCHACGVVELHRRREVFASSCHLCGAAVPPGRRVFIAVAPMLAALDVCLPCNVTLVDPASGPDQTSQEESP